MAGARDELRDAVAELPDRDAELLLSFLHLLKGRREAASAALANAILEGIEDEEQAWMSLSQPALERDWGRAEEEEAWADL